MVNLDNDLKQKILRFQKVEITEYQVYKKLAAYSPEPNKTVLNKIAEDEKRHGQIWQNYTQTQLAPDGLKIFFYTALAKILGLTFALKIMENGEEKAQAGYQKVINAFPETQKIFEEEKHHEQELLNIIQEEKLDYIGSIVLGLNDALVELTGALAGLSLALQNTRLVAVAGTITGVAAAMSMAASEYLSKKAEEQKTPFKSAAYTGAFYIITVILLVIPFFVFNSYKIALPLTLVIAILIIAAFNFFSAVVKNTSFKSKFLEMAAISLGVATISFGISYLLKTFIGIEA
ncbi:MAG: rubrerythrin family protein [Candidatus Buchananbacteria bacterium RIFCSPHIGHO2_01_FULL_44_11]|uniref:Rubrerythrin family protein n=1 Tax=Candidatus Buchananbacteria bacterium RIFCSPHIGHO2_01_FULL_44_11 TaxID=1797535 RepID=A0A1G1XZU8_9BACT|nr:MAG: rubrerythrin family protein [Candidatus Buchananbacteria bacterium RIFCSPHIGHO2_01_FULL_44_11]